MTANIDPPQPDNTTGAVLAGGGSRRMGGNKALLPFGAVTMIERVIAALMPTCSAVTICAGRSADRYRHLPWSAVTDRPGQCGPLAGIQAGFNACHTEWLLVAPCDLPLLTPVFGTRLQKALAAGGNLAFPVAAGRGHFACLLAHRSLHSSLTRYLASGERRIEPWLRDQNPRAVDFSDLPDLLLNTNTPEDLALARQLATNCVTPTPATGDPAP